MNANRFDTLDYANKLKKAGLDSKVAEVIAHEQGNIIKEDKGNLVTKDYLSNELLILRKDTDTQFLSMRKDMDAKFKDIDTKFVELELRIGKLIVRSGLASVGLIGAIQAILKFFPWST